MKTLESISLVNGNGQKYSVGLPTVEIHGYINDAALDRIKENTGMCFVNKYHGVYTATPENSGQIIALLLTYNWLTRYYNCMDIKNTLVLRADLNTPAMAKLYYRHNGKEFLGIG